MGEALPYDQLLSDVEARLERLRALYDMYFQGLERLEPLVVRKDFERRLHQLQKTRAHSTALRFRAQMLQQRYVTLQGHWRRITRQIEEGRYKPHVQKAQRLLHSAPKPSARRVRQTDPAPPPATEVTAPTASETSPWQAIGERYLAARRRNGEITGNLNAATVARRIEAMLPKLRARHPDRAIDFEVTEHQGRVALRPVLIDLGE